MADAKVTALTEETAPVGADLVYLVDDVAGTPTSKKATLTNLAASAPFAGAYAPIAAAGCRLTKSANQTIASAATNAVTFDGEGFDVGGYHDNATNNTRITIPTGKGGLYLFGAAFQWNADSYGLYFFKVDGTTDIPGGDRKTQDTNGGATTTLLSLTAGQYVEFMVTNSSTEDDVRGGSGSGTSASFWCTRIGA